MRGASNSWSRRRRLLPSMSCVSSSIGYGGQPSALPADRAESVGRIYATARRRETSRRAATKQPVDATRRYSEDESSANVRGFGQQIADTSGRSGSGLTWPPKSKLLSFLSSDGTAGRGSHFHGLPGRGLAAAPQSPWGGSHGGLIRPQRRQRAER